MLPAQNRGLGSTAVGALKNKSEATIILNTTYKQLDAATRCTVTGQL